jgi:dolichol-phosphate mannosyltransferase
VIPDPPPESAGSAAGPVSFSVVIPFFNEAASAYGVVDELGRDLTALGSSWEALLVDDGSTDRTAAELERARARWPQCRVFRLGRNRGQGAALLHGIERARAPVIGMMDGDGQNVPADFGPLRALLDRCDLAVGVRTPRNDSLLRRLMSRLANTVRSRLLRDHLSDAGCALKVFRRELVPCFLPVDMLNPFMAAFAVAAGFRVAERPVQHRPRRAGQAHYGFRRMLWRPTLDLLAISWVLRRRIPTASNRTLPDGSRRLP